MKNDPSTGVRRIEPKPLPTVEECSSAKRMLDRIELHTGTGGSEHREPFAVDAFHPATYFRTKGPLIRTAGVVLLVASLPFIACLMALVRSTSRGPAIYRQRRVGMDGKVFTMFKLRTMYDGAEQLTGPVWSQSSDSRITPLGKVLRRLHLDELPQLWNVARGDMDLVGPRPERPHFVTGFVKTIPGYARRHLVRPGITGLAQINLPPDETIESVHRKLVLDIEYIANARANLDLRILGCTALRMCGLRHGRAVRLLGLERSVPKQPRAMYKTNGEPGGNEFEDVKSFPSQARALPISAPLVQRMDGDRVSDKVASCSSGLSPRRPK